MTKHEQWLRRAIRAALLAPLVAGACYFGPSVENFPPATAPGGADVTVRLRRRAVQAELIAVSDSALVVRDEARLLRVRWADVEYVRVARFGEFYPYRAGAPRELDQLRRVSRFPQGLTPQIERTMLGALGRDSIEVVP